MKSFALIGGEVVSSEFVAKKDVLISRGKIISVVDSGQLDLDDISDLEIIDCSGKMILPGVVDVHVHFREPGHSYKEDWTSGSKAAVSGGVTSVFDMPNNNPPVVSIADLDAKRDFINGRSYVNYGIYIGFNGENLDEINNAKNIPGVKFYACNSTGDMGVDTGVGELFEKCNKTIVVHSEDESIISENKKRIVADKSDDELTHDLHSEIRSAEAALSMTKRLCELTSQTAAKMHVAHLSTAAELDVINEYRQNGANITCEVAPHHLLFSTDDYEYFGSKLRMNPPVRSSENLFALWKGLQLGEIDLVATDHAPHLLKEKLESFSKVPSGVPGVEFILPIMLNAVNNEVLTIQKVVELCTEKPVEIFGVKNKGYIKEGFDADLVVVDMNEEKSLSDEEIVSKCGWSPYSDSMFQGWPVQTFVNADLVFDYGKFTESVSGREIQF